jgi:hypothetical protein
MSTHHPKDPRIMSASAINKELDALDKKNSILTDKFIAAGRGHERPSDWRHMTDSLSVAQNALFDRRSDLVREIQMRMGPGAYRRLPPRFGPLKHNLHLKFSKPEDI